MVDIGSGAGHSTHIADKYAMEIIGVEIVPKLLEMAKHRLPHIEFTEGDARALPFEDSSFNAAMCLTVLCNFATEEDIARSMREASRVLTSGGTLVITVPHPATVTSSYPARRERSFEEHFNYNSEGTPYNLKLYEEGGSYIEVVNYHWPISTYLNNITRAKMQITSILEPVPTIYLGAENAEPVYLMIIAQKS